MLKETFRKHQSIKISIIWVYIKPEINKNDTTAMAGTMNEAFIG